MNLQWTKLLIGRYMELYPNGKTFHFSTVNHMECTAKIRGARV